MGAHMQTPAGTAFWATLAAASLSSAVIGWLVGQNRPAAAQEAREIDSDDEEDDDSDLAQVKAGFVEPCKLVRLSCDLA